MVDNVEVASTEWHLRRRAVPIMALGLMTCAWLVLQALPPDRLDRGMRNTFSFVAGMIAAIVVGVWFFGMAGVPRRTRGIAAVALLLLVGGFLASVRNVEFSGDMEPTFDFRWQPSRESKLAAYLASEKKASASSVKKVAAGSNHGAAPIDGSVADVAHSDSVRRHCRVPRTRPATVAPVATALSSGRRSRAIGPNVRRAAFGGIRAAEATRRLP